MLCLGETRPWYRRQSFERIIKRSTNQLFNWSSLYRGLATLMGNQIWEEWTIILEKNYRWKFTSSTAAALFRSGTFGNKVPKVSISFQGPSPYVVLLRELIPFFQWFLSRKYYPLLISSTVIVPIIHIKNKAGVCSSILKIKMKNENCHKRELGSNQNSTLGCLLSEYQLRCASAIFAPSTTTTCQEGLLRLHLS